jgi:glycosyltransferase involved in cell wall biosynthesis
VRICYFGTFDADYVRNQVIIAGLRIQGADVVVCHVPFWEDTAHKVRETTKGLLNPHLWVHLLRIYIQLVRQYLKVGAYDVMIVGYAGHIDMLLARILTWVAHKPLVFDAFLSLHETIVEDRGLAGRRSLMSAATWTLERLDCLLADLILMDTRANAQDMAARYHIPEHKLRHLWVGVLEDYVRSVPPREAGRPFTVLYFGKFIPLHGIEYILQAAQVLGENSDIRFEFIGDGQTYQALRDLAERLRLSNIYWGPHWLPPQALAQRIAQADVCLGIFGTSAKAARVIPTKAYVTLAMQKALVTEDSPAAREVLVSGEHALLCPPGDPQALARCVLTLKENPDMRARLALQGHQLFLRSFTTQALGATMLQYLTEVVTTHER